MLSGAAPAETRRRVPASLTQVFINGSYAGTAKENKTMRLRPGSYNIEIREGGETTFAEQIYVVAGKTLHLHPAL